MAGPTTATPKPKILVDLRTTAREVELHVWETGEVEYIVADMQTLEVTEVRVEQVHTRTEFETVLMAIAQRLT